MDILVYKGIRKYFPTFSSFVTVFLGGGGGDDEDKMKVIYSPAKPPPPRESIFLSMQTCAYFFHFVQACLYVSSN